ncbi:class I SAM-dependent methyltransferase [Roseburia hominis]
MMELSKRLKAVADLVTPGMRLADVGTDHGYVPIYLVERGIVPSAIAMDVNKGPLERAREHIRECALEEKISTRLSDGLTNLKIEETDSVIAAGMGGGLVIRIFSEQEEKAVRLKELILQPQSEIAKVRRYLNENGWRIIKEDMVLEDRKFYPMMKAVRGEGQPYSEEELEFGKLLLQEKHPVLRQYLEREKKIGQSILAELSLQKGERILERREVLLHRIERIDRILGEYGSRRGGDT